MDEHFKYPPGIRTAQEWSRGESFVIPEIEAIQRDAVSAARRELQGLDVLAANNAAHKDKICKCKLSAANLQSFSIYYLDSVQTCIYCGRAIL